MTDEEHLRKVISETVNHYDELKKVCEQAEATIQDLQAQIMGMSCTIESLESDKAYIYDRLKDALKYC